MISMFKKIFKNGSVLKGFPMTSLRCTEYEIFQEARGADPMQVQWFAKWWSTAYDTWPNIKPTMCTHFVVNYLV